MELSARKKSMIHVSFELSLSYNILLLLKYILLRFFILVLKYSFRLDLNVLVSYCHKWLCNFVFC